MDIAKGLKYFRAKKGITQTELAKFLGVNNSNVSNWEKGIAKPDIDMLVRIADYFEISVDELIFVEKNQKKMNYFSIEKASPENKPRKQAQNKELHSKLTPQLDIPKQYNPNDGLTHDFEAQFTIEELEQSIKLLEKEVANKEALIQSKDEMIAMQKEAISLATRQFDTLTAAIESLTVYLNKERKKPSTTPAALSALDVDASG